MQKEKELFLGYAALIYSITLIFTLTNNFITRTSEHWRFFYAFTNQSNIMILIWAILFGIYSFTKSEKLKFTTNSVVLIALTVYISITYFISILILDPVYTTAFNPVKSSSELWHHHLTPIFMWIMFFKVKTEEKLNVKTTLLTLIYPLFYVVLNLTLGYTLKYENGDMAFAYGFINPNTYGGNFFIFLGVILGLLIIFSSFSIGLSKLKNYLNDELTE